LPSGRMKRKGSALTRDTRNCCETYC
jgi:hypothetical protein